MLEREEYFMKIMSGNTNAYHDFLTSIQNRKISCSYKVFFDYLLKQEDISKCDYYALYDAFHHFLQLVSTKPENYLEHNFYKKIENAALKGNIAAQCCLIIYSKHNQSSEAIKKIINNSKKNALSIRAKNNNSVKSQWANVLLGLYNHLISKDKNDDATIKYLEDAYKINDKGECVKNNAAAAHYLITNFYTKDKKVNRKTLLLAKEYEKVSDYLISLNLLVVDIYLTASRNNNKNSLTNEYSNPFCGPVLEHFLEHFEEFNLQQTNFLRGLYELLINSKSHVIAIRYLTKAEQYGHPDAASEIEKLESELRQKVELAKKNQVQTFILNNENVSAKNKSSAPKYLDRNGEGYKISFHGNLPIRIKDGIDRYSNRFIEEKLFSEILNVIANDEKVSEIEFCQAIYVINIDHLLENISKNKNINSIVIRTSPFNILDFMKILNFVCNKDQIQHLTINGIYFEIPINECKQEDFERYNKSIIAKFINIVSKIKGLKSLTITGLLSDDDQVKDFLNAIQRNPFLKNTCIKLRDVNFNNKNLLLLADVLNNNLCHFSFKSDEHEFDAKGVHAFTKRIENNTNLISLGLNGFLDNDSTDDLIESSNLLFDTLICKTNIELLNLKDTIYPVNKPKYLIKNVRDSLKKTKTLKAINLSSNQLKDPDIREIAYIFKNPSPIKKLILDENNFTHNGIQVLTEILGKYPNNIQCLSMQGLAFDNNSEDISPAKLYQALADMFNSPLCVIDDLRVTFYLRSNKQEDLTAFNNFLQAVQSHKKIRKLSFNGILKDEIIQKFVSLVTQNTNIAEIIYPHNVENLSNTEKSLQEKLDYNRSLHPKSETCLEENTKNLLPQTSPVDIKKIEQVTRKANKDTFKKILENIPVKYELILDEENKKITIIFSEKEIAKIAYSIFNTLGKIADLDDMSVKIPNYEIANEKDILSLSLLLSKGLQQDNSSVDPNKNLSWLDNLYNLKHLKINEQGNNLVLRLPLRKINKDIADNILRDIRQLLNTKDIKYIALGNGIEIVNYKNIDPDKLTGLATSIKAIINQHYIKNKFINNNNNNNGSFQDITVKLNSVNPQNKIGESKKVPGKNEFSSNNSLIETTQNVPLEQELVQKTDNIKVECIINNNSTISELPTEEKFRKLISSYFKEESESSSQAVSDSLMHLIFSHHNALLNLSAKSNDNDKLAYFILYHSIRISELSYQYFNINYMNQSKLCSSAYASRNILADRSDYFLPNSIDKTISYLHTNSNSFLTVSRQILLDLFDKSQGLKTKLELGYTTLPYYSDILTSSENTKIKLSLPKELTTNLVNVLEQMKKLINFVQYCLKDMDINVLLTSNSFESIELGALKATIFLLGHYARIIRDHYHSFLKESIFTGICQNYYSSALRNILFELFDTKFIQDEKFNLLTSFENLKDEQIREIAHVASFADHCLLFIAARNAIGHSNEEALEENKLDMLNDIPTRTIIYLSKFFAGNSFIEQLDSISNLTRQKDQNVKSENVNTTSPSKLNPYAVPFLSNGASNDGAQTDSEKHVESADCTPQL